MKSRAGRARQPPGRAWPVTGTAAGKLSTSPGEFSAASPHEQRRVLPLWCRTAAAGGFRARAIAAVLGYRCCAQFTRGTSRGLRFHQRACPAEDRAGDSPKTVWKPRRDELSHKPGMFLLRQSTRRVSSRRWDFKGRYPHVPPDRKQHSCRRAGRFPAFTGCLAREGSFAGIVIG